MMRSSLEILQQETWALELPDGQDERIVSFKGGPTISAGIAVRTYEHVGTTLIATAGEDVRIIVDLNSPFTDTFNARLLTQSGGDLLEDAILSRIAWN